MEKVIQELLSLANIMGVEYSDYCYAMSADRGIEPAKADLENAVREFENRLRSVIGGYELQLESIGAGGVERLRAPAEPALSCEEIRGWWMSDNELEDCDMCKLDDFTKVVRAVEARRAARAQAPAAAEPVANQCQGVPDPRCNYLASCGRICNKCGQLHNPMLFSLQAAPAADPVAYQFQDREGNWLNFVNEQHRLNTIEEGSWPIRALYAAPTTKAEPAPEVIGEKFQRAWVQLDELPGGMMDGTRGRFGPIPASCSAWITTSESERDRCRASGKTMLEVWLTPQAAPADALHAETPFLQDTDQYLLHRFIETSDDDEHYDLSKDEVKRLANLGVLESCGFGRYSVSMFGHWAHERYWHQSPSLPLKTNSDRDREKRASIAAQAAQTKGDA